MSYHGHTNYETWVTRLWADNEEGTSLYIRELARGYRHAVSGLADALREMLEETLLEDIETTGLRLDLLTHALGKVDWHTWATDLIAELEEDEDETDDDTEAEDE